MRPHLRTCLLALVALAGCTPTELPTLPADDVPGVRERIAIAQASQIRADKYHCGFVESGQNLDACRVIVAKNDRLPSCSAIAKQKDMRSTRSIQNGFLSQ